MFHTTHGVFQATEGIFSATEATVPDELRVVVASALAPTTTVHVRVLSSGVSNDVEPGKVVLGEPAIDLRERKLQLAAMSKLPEMRRDLKQLAARMAALEGGGGRDAAEAA